ncbi:uncharacterized protein [Cicer arietinum]|uniref:Heavy metal-associated isoprenylated plant protein 37-like n=1 Tax=Cicer arietinum TaxID=3827 RepID=A0A1S2YDE4_CICAR|nr:heavy metal-associated isoprenylated plant protein 37-like [Cicer arietinum]
MSTNNENELSKIETFVLKVHMNCQGCRTKVRKILRKVEGVYEVKINAEEQKVIVTGIVNPSTLLQKLAKLGKHAEILNEDYNQEHTTYHDKVKDNNDNNQEYIINNQSTFENQYMIPPYYGKDNWGPEWCYNQHFAAAAPLFFESYNNRANENVIRINEYPKWQENSGTDYYSLGNYVSRMA